jgi:hypothetical protein
LKPMEERYGQMTLKEKRERFFHLRFQLVEYRALFLDSQKK